MPADTLGPGLTPLARPCNSARAVQDQSASPRRRLTRWLPRGGGLCACAAGVGQFPVLVECLCAQKGFVHTSLALAEDDGGLVAGWCPSSRCVRAPCSHSLFYADRLACAGALRVPGFILIAHGSNGRVVYRPGDGCSACARIGTRDETSAGTRDETRVCHGQDARDAVFCALAVGAAVACFANEATQPPTFVAWFDGRSSLSSRWQARSIDSPGSSHRENGSLPGRK